MIKILFSKLKSQIIKTLFLKYYYGRDFEYKEPMASALEAWKNAAGVEEET